jgi:hypothetical protein
MLEMLVGTMLLVLILSVYCILSGRALVRLQEQLNDLDGKNYAFGVLLEQLWESVEDVDDKLVGLDNVASVLTGDVCEMDSVLADLTGDLCDSIDVIEVVDGKLDAVDNRLEYLSDQLSRLGADFDTWTHSARLVFRCQARSGHTFECTGLTKFKPVLDSEVEYYFKCSECGLRYTVSDSQLTKKEKELVRDYLNSLVPSKKGK